MIGIRLRPPVLLATLSLVALGAGTACCAGGGRHAARAGAPPGTSTPSESAPAAPAAGPVIVMGFVGGYVRHDDLVHSVVQVAAHLRQDYASGVYVAVYENRRGEQAHQEILRLLDDRHEGKLTAKEKRDARIIIYGHSWGASAAVALARDLERDAIPVLLTIQVDSISARGEDDGVIPANVSQAVNFYQLDGFLHGRPEIRAADAARTQILGNFRQEYKTHPIACDQYPWYNRLFMKAHTEIECDPNVWKKVETLIRSKLPPKESASAR